MPDKTDATIPVDRLQAFLLPVADAVMVLMWSRPESGTLRTTMVTLPTIALGAGVAVTAAVLAVLSALLAGSGGGLGWWSAAVFLVVLALACLDLATFGVRQRLQLRSRDFPSTVDH